MLYAGILGSEEELNNYKRWETHEGNTEVQGDEICGLNNAHSLDRLVDRLENRIARMQREECNEMISSQGTRAKGGVTG